MQKMIANIFIQYTLLAKGSWDPVIKVLTPFINSTLSFLQGITVGVVTLMAIWYKIREVTSSQQEEQQYTQKTKTVLIACVVIFLLPTIVNVLQSFFS